MYISNAVLTISGRKHLATKNLSWDATQKHHRGELQELAFLQRLLNARILMGSQFSVITSPSQVFLGSIFALLWSL